MRLIDRDALVETLDISESCNECQYQSGIFCERNSDFVNACEAIYDAPIIEERKTGRWIDMDDHVMCSCCGATHYGADKNYCPNCGADMREGEQE